MSKKGSKRFHSGQEIMEEFVPGYSPPSIPNEEISTHVISPGVLLAQSLLEGFISRINSLKSKSSNPKPDSAQ